MGVITGEREGQGITPPLLSSDLKTLHLRIRGCLFPSVAVIQLDERWHLDGTLRVVAQYILLQYQERYHLLLSPPPLKKKTYNFVTQNPAPHIDLRTVTLDFPRNVGIPKFLHDASYVYQKHGRLFHP